MREVHPQGAAVKPVDPAALQARLVREQRARKAAEALIEAKSTELFEANNELAQVLSGSIKVLTDVLAMAKPEVFQKAAKVQRWARRLSKAIDVERPWELDLAAMLYPLGVIALPEEITSKYALGKALTTEEQVLVEESPAAALKLLEKIPRMQGVGRSIYYCRKGFDGSGFPQDEVRGEDIPQAARILRVLVDLADKATGVEKTRAEAFAEMAKNKQVYDMKIFKVCFETLHAPEQLEEAGKKIMELAPSLLQPGDIVHRDIVDKDGHLMLAAGAELTEIGIRRLHTIYIQKGLRELVAIVRTTEDAGT